MKTKTATSLCPTLRIINIEQAMIKRCKKKEEEGGGGGGGDDSEKSKQDTNNTET